MSMPIIAAIGAIIGILGFSGSVIYFVYSVSKKSSE